MTAMLPTSGLSAEIRPEWLATRTEAILMPDLPIVDAHHHLWDRPGDRYLVENFAADVNSGHRILSSVYVDCRSMYRRSGPPALRAVGEVEFACGMAAIGESGHYGDTCFCAAIVGHADLRLGREVNGVLNAMARAGGGRFRGIRQVASWDADARVSRPMVTRPPGLLLDADFRRGFAVLAELGCSFDAFVFHPQLDDVADLAAAFPETRIILDHCGGPVGLGPYAERREAAFSDWKHAIARVARHPNVSVKLSGLGMRMAGFDFHTRPIPPSSEDLAIAWRPYLESCIEAFGIERCMFASNFSPDKGSCTYRTLWNAFKRFGAAFSDDERHALFHANAARIYAIDRATGA
jgi:predicted TIM-barrel fold metal-dependent hydrolase